MLMSYNRQKNMKTRIQRIHFVEFPTSHITTCRLKMSDFAEAFLRVLTSGAIQNCDEIFHGKNDQADRQQRDMRMCTWAQDGERQNICQLLVVRNVLDTKKMTGVYAGLLPTSVTL